nr:Arm DNA-binding domain-containing protein [Streptococcus sp. 11-4097]
IKMASFRKRKDKWEYRIRYKEMGKYKETSKGGFKTKKGAQLAAAKVEEKLATGGNLKDSKITFNEYLYEWLNTYKKGNVAPRTYMVYEKNIRVHILPAFGELRLKDL